MKETEYYGYEEVRAEQQELGDKVRALLIRNRFKSVAADGFQAPGAVVIYTDDPENPERQEISSLGSANLRR